MAKARSVRGRFGLLWAEPLLGYKGIEGPGGGSEPRSGACASLGGRFGILGREARSPDRGRRHRRRHQALADHRKVVLHGTGLRVMLAALAFCRGKGLP